MAIDRTGAGADAPARPKRSGGRSATAFLPREECRRRSPQAGEESWRRPLRFRRTRRSRPPSRLAHHRTHPKTAGPNQVERKRRKHLTAPAPQRGRQPPAPAPPRAHSGPPPPATNGPRQAPSTPPVSGRTTWLRFPAYPGRRARDGTRERALLGQALHRIDPAHIRDGRVEAAEPDHTNLIALTDSRATRREAGRANARSGEDASKAKRPNGREPPMDARRPLEAQHLASTGMAGRGSKNTGTCPRTMGERGLTTGGVPLYGA